MRFARKRNRQRDNRIGGIGNDMIDGLMIDSFAGAGGASLGVAWAIGRAPDIAINHDASALAMHEANHPSTRHVCEDVWKANLRELVAGREVGLLWASPDCKHFSRAKGSVPVSKHIRSLAWVAVRWASQVRPRMIMLENVREFADWGPLVPRWECKCGWRGTEDRATLIRTRRRCPRCESRSIRPTLDLVPDPLKRGMTFRLFVNRLRGLPYDVSWRTLNASDFGERKGSRCRIVARGAMNSCLIEFEDGFRVLTSRYAVRK
jgi:DNA (cytosine-5)-methyltransferase 1